VTLQYILVYYKSVHLAKYTLQLYFENNQSYYETTYKDQKYCQKYSEVQLY